MPISDAAKSISSIGARRMSPKKFIQSARAAAKVTGFNELKAARMAKAVTRGKALTGSFDTKKKFVGVMKEAGTLNKNRYAHAPTSALRAYEKAVTGDVKDSKVQTRLANRARSDRQEVNRAERAEEDGGAVLTPGKDPIRSLGQNSLDDAAVSITEVKRLKAEQKKEPPKSAPLVDMFGGME